VAEKSAWLKRRRAVCARKRGGKKNGNAVLRARSPAARRRKNKAQAGVHGLCPVHISPIVWLNKSPRAGRAKHAAPARHPKRQACRSMSRLSSPRPKRGVRVVAFSVGGGGRHEGAFSLRFSSRVCRQASLLLLPMAASLPS